LSSPSTAAAESRDRTAAGLGDQLARLDPGQPVLHHLGVGAVTRLQEDRRLGRGQSQGDFFGIDTYPKVLSYSYSCLFLSQTYELEQATCKCMRGLLKAMIGQRDRVERFKESFSPKDSIHAKFSANTGLSVRQKYAWTQCANRHNVRFCCSGRWRS
jgi:hypothetical protein